MMRKMLLPRTMNKKNLIHLLFPKCTKVSRLPPKFSRYIYKTPSKYIRITQLWANQL